MDNKKKDLTPELKQIYERVMNTQVKATPPPQKGPVTNQPPVPQTPPPAQPHPDNHTEHAANAADHPAFATLEPQPLKGGADKPFIFSSGKKIDEHTEKKSASSIKAPGNMKISPVIIMVGFLVFVIVYAVVWAKIFGMF